MFWGRQIYFEELAYVFMQCEFPLSALLAGNPGKLVMLS
jgi:hypothetical protein